VNESQQLSSVGPDSVFSHFFRPLFQRVLEMTNQHTGFNLEPPGQEDFTIIQYNPADQYTYVTVG
jgi:hypothetical protein